MLHHGVENGEQLSHTGSESHLLGFSCVTQALVETANDGITAGPHPGRYVQCGPDMSAAAPHGPFASKRPAIAVQGSDSNECGNLLPTQGPQFGEIHNQRPGEPWPYPWHRAGQIVFLLPDGTLLNGVGQRSLGLRHLTFESRDVRMSATSLDLTSASPLPRWHLNWSNPHAFLRLSCFLL
jgi:hypothetical protein